MYTYIYIEREIDIYIYIYIEREREIREMGGAPRNLAPRNNLLVWIVKPSGCHCTDGHLTSRVFPEDQQLSYSAEPP